MSNFRALDQMEWLQEGLYLALLATPFFGRLNFVLERKFRADKETQLEAIWLNGRGGSAGAGCLVEMPKTRTDKPNSQVNTILGSLVIFEERNINVVPGTGTGKSAEQWASCLGEFMRGWIMGQFGGLVPEQNFITPADDWIRDEDGIIALRVSIEQRQSRKIFTRCDCPRFGLNAGMVTLANGADSPGATIFYTLDGSFPGDPASAGELGGSSQVYDAPFAVSAGQVVSWMAAAGGCDFPSNVGLEVIS